jgi:hypothetical protein
MKPHVLTLATALLLGCGAPAPAPMTPLQAPTAGCASLSYSKAELRFRCDGVTYDLLATPLRSQRVFDIVSRQAFTRRYFQVRVGRRRYAFKTEQLQGEAVPRRVVLETPRGFARLLLDPQGQVVWSGRVSDLNLNL